MCTVLPQCDGAKPNGSCLAGIEVLAIGLKNGWYFHLRWFWWWFLWILPRSLMFFLLAISLSHMNSLNQTRCFNSQLFLIYTSNTNIATLISFFFSRPTHSPPATATSGTDMSDVTSFHIPASHLWTERIEANSRGKQETFCWETGNVTDILSSRKRWVSLLGY